MNAQAMLSWLRAPNQTPAQQLAALRDSFIDEIRKLDDRDHQMVVLAFEQRFADPELATELAELLEEIAREYQVAPIKKPPTSIPAELAAAILSDLDNVAPYEALAKWMMRERGTDRRPRLGFEALLAGSEITEVEWIVLLAGLLPNVRFGVQRT